MSAYWTPRWRHQPAVSGSGSRDVSTVASDDSISIDHTWIFGHVLTGLDTCVCSWHMCCLPDWRHGHVSDKTFICKISINSRSRSIIIRNKVTSYKDFSGIQIDCLLRCSMKILYVKEYFLNGWKLWHTWWQRPFNVYLLMRVLQMKQSDLSRLPPKYLRVVHKCRLHSFCYQAI